MLTGTAALDELVPDRATISSFDTEAVTLRGAEIVQVLAEIRIDGRQRSLPSGLHPTNPPTAVFQVWSCGDSPWGPFRMAQARVGCRSGLRPRGFVQGCIIDNDAAAAALRHRWGLPTQAGEVTLVRGYDAVTASARLAGEVVLAITGVDPEPLAAHDVAFTTTIALAETPRGTRLVQIDVDVAPERSERLRPRLDAFRADGWMHESVDPYYAVSASISLGDVTIQGLRYVSKPEELAFSGTESVGGGEG
jgi:hypothetical protein